jgi:hypothetical protein
MTVAPSRIVKVEFDVDANRPLKRTIGYAAARVATEGRDAKPLAEDATL